MPASIAGWPANSPLLDEHMKIARYALVLVTVLAGCNDNRPAGVETAKPAAATSTASAAAPAGEARPFVNGTAVTDGDFAAPGVTMTVTPNPYNGCDFPHGQAVVDVGFDARPAGIKHAQIWVQGRGGKQNLWGQAPGYKAAQPTGKWMVDGMKLLLVDMDGGKLVAATTVRAAPCR
jgi:hypothetical protein